MKQIAASNISDNPDARERILRAAARLFRHHGYHRTTVRNIADEVGLLSGSLFHHFRSKEHILVEMLRQAVVSMHSDATLLLEGVTEPAQRLRTLVQFELECYAGRQTGDYFSVLVTEWRDVSAELRPVLTSVRKQYRSLVKSVLKECAEEGLLRPPLEGAILLMHSLTTSTVTWFNFDGRYTVEGYADIISGLLLEAPAAPKGCARTLHPAALKEAHPATES